MESLKPYYPIFRFVSVFFGLYILLSIGYYLFLDMEWNITDYPDPITAQIAYQTKEVLIYLGFDTLILNTQQLPSITLYIDGKIMYRVIEGCNAVSVMILFTSFILAFANGFLKTLKYTIMGIVMIYLINIIRLVVLAIVYKEYDQYAHFTHEIIFPSIIYGAVVLLWIYWIRQIKTPIIEKS